MPKGVEQGWSKSREHFIKKTYQARTRYGAKHTRASQSGSG